MQQTAVNTYHRSIDSLPLDRFVDCMVDNNLAALIISGMPTNTELQEAWAVIQSEYTDRIGSNEYKMYVKLYKEIADLKIELLQVNLLAHRGDEARGIEPGILRYYYDEHFAEELNRLLKTKCRFNNLDSKSYHAELDKCINRSKAKKIQLDLKLLSFEAIEKKNQAKPGEKLTRAYFTSMLVTLSDHVKYQLPETIKMGEYCERLKRFITACEKAN